MADPPKRWRDPPQLPENPAWECTCGHNLVFHQPWTGQTGCHAHGCSCEHFTAKGGSTTLH